MTKIPRQGARDPEVVTDKQVSETVAGLRFAQNSTICATESRGDRLEAVS